MYELHREILIVNGSASAFSKNFTCLRMDKTFAAVVNKNQVSQSTHINIINWDQKIEGMNNDQIAAREPSSGSSGGGAKTMPVLQVKYCALQGRSQPVIVVCTTGGTLVYEWMGSSVLFFLPISKGNKENWAYMKGIGVALDLVYVGSSVGEVSCVQIKESSVKLKTTLKDMKVAVTDVEADDDMVVAAGIDGTLIGWTHDFKVINKISTGQTINALIVYKSMAFCATVLGQIVVYGVKSGAIQFDIAAHSRCINALDLAPEVGLILSGSEDSFVRVWKVHKGDPMEVECIFSQAVENVPVTGGTFIDPRGHAFAITGYDYSTIFYYNRVKSDKRAK